MTTQTEANESVQKQTAMIKTVESRMAQIDCELSQFDEALAEAAFLNEKPINFAKKATERQGLELEKSLLPGVIDRLNEVLKPLRKIVEHLAWQETERECQQAENSIIEKIRRMKSEGEQDRNIRSECGLTEIEYTRYADMAKRS